MNHGEPDGDGRLWRDVFGVTRGGRPHLARQHHDGGVDVWCGAAIDLIRYVDGETTDDPREAGCVDCLRAVGEYAVKASVRLCAILFPRTPPPPDPGDVEVASWSPS